LREDGAERARLRVVATSQSLAVVPRLVRTKLERVLRAVIRRLPPRVQRLSTTAVESLVDRWPILARLLRVVPAAAGSASTERGANGRMQSAFVDTSVVDPTVADASAQHPEPLPNAAGSASVPSEVTAAGLVRALRDPSAEVAANAAEALREHPSDATLTALLQTVENRDGYFSPLTRASAIRTLGALLPLGQGDPIAAAVSAVDAEVSLAAIAALVERDDARSVEALLEVLENRRGFYLPLTRQAAARGLLRLEVPHDARLRKLFDTETDEDVRESLVPLFPWITPP
jgi:hypothetical protein